MRALPCILLTCLLAIGQVARAQEPALMADDEAERPAPRAISRKPGQAITPKGAPADKSSAKPASPASSGNWWSMIGSLAIVLAAIGGVAGLLRMQLPAARGLLPRDVLYDLGRRPLDVRTVIHLLRCGSRILVVGCSPQGMTTLAEITDPIEVDYLTGLCKAQTTAGTGPDFQTTLRKFFGMDPREPVAESADSEPEPSSDDVASQRLKERLRQGLSGAASAEALHG